jgi:hypothetical protein
LREVTVKVLVVYQVLEHVLLGEANVSGMHFDDLNNLVGADVVHLEREDLHLFPLFRELDDVTVELFAVVADEVDELRADGVVLQSSVLLDEGVLGADHLPDVVRHFFLFPTSCC